MPPARLYWHLVNSKLKFDPDWLVQVIEDAIPCDPYLQNHPEVVTFLKTKIPSLKLLYTRLNADGYEKNINFCFVDSKNPNQPGSQWQFKRNITIYGQAADLIFDIMIDDAIGAIEIWLHRQ